MTEERQTILEGDGCDEAVNCSANCFYARSTAAIQMGRVFESLGKNRFKRLAGEHQLAHFLSMFFIEATL